MCARWENWDEIENDDEVENLDVVADETPTINSVNAFLEAAKRPVPKRAARKPRRRELATVS